MPDENGVRAVALVGGEGAGKTTLARALGSPPGRPDPLEVIDSPGLLALAGEVGRAIEVADGAVLVASSVAGVRHQVERTCDLLAGSGKVLLAAVTHLDEEGASWDRVLSDLESSLGLKPVPVALPAGTGPACRGIVDLIHMRLEVPSGGDGDGVGTGPLAIPADLGAQAEQARTTLVEAVTDVDDGLLERYVAAGTLTGEEILGGLSLGARARRFIPVACVLPSGPGGGAAGLAMLALLLRRVVPAPGEAPVEARDAAGNIVRVAPAPGAPVLARVIQTRIDHFAGRQNTVRVLAGTLRRDATVLNPRTGALTRVSHLFRGAGAQRVEIDQAGPGELAVVIRIEDARTGDTLCDRDLAVALPDLAAPSRPVGRALRSEAPDEKVSAALHRMVEEDPGLAFFHSPDTGETQLWGTSEEHLEWAAEQALRRHGIAFSLAPAAPAYRETITAAGKAQGKYRRQTGGHGQYGDCHLEVEPIPHGAGFEFEDAIVGGVVPRQFVPSVEKGVRSAMAHGPLAGYPVVDVKVRLVFGSYHHVDSSDLAFQIAGSLAFKKAIAGASQVLLEPIMAIEVTVPDDVLGGVLSDLTGRRARVQGMDPVPRGTRVRAFCPQVELSDYDAELRSLTQGAGAFTVGHSHYEPVPAHLAARIIERRRAEIPQHVHSLA